MWGVPVPGDPGQVIYVWYDALVNYLTGPGFGTDPERFAQWWTGADEVVHVIGKGVLRFHAVYWIAMLLSAGVRLPDVIFVHEYVTSGGAKLGKSAGNGADPVDVAASYGRDPLRWWLLRGVARTTDTDYSADRLIAAANQDLANNLGNLVSRTLAMLTKYRGATAPSATGDGDARGAAGDGRAVAAPLRLARAAAGEAIDAALAGFDFRAAVATVVRIGDEANRYVEAVRPWELAAAERAGAGPEVLDAVLAELVASCRDIGWHLQPFLPELAARITAQCDGARRTPVFRRLQPAP